jgi:hypothetical protein
LPIRIEKSGVTLFELTNDGGIGTQWRNLKPVYQSTTAVNFTIATEKVGPVMMPYSKAFWSEAFVFVGPTHIFWAGKGESTFQTRDASPNDRILEVIDGYGKGFLRLQAEVRDQFDGQDRLRVYFSDSESDISKGATSWGSYIKF